MFAGMNSGISLADIAAVTKGNGDGNDGFGGNNGWWVLIILFALFGGWGNGNGYNNGGGQNGGVGSEVQRGFDTATIVTKLDGLNSGICSLGYDQLAQMNNLGGMIQSTGYAVQQAVQADTVANMQNTNALATQISNCCCENRTGQMQIMNAMDKNACALGNQLNNLGQAIMQNDNANFRSLNDQLRDGFTALAMAQKDAEIASLTARLNVAERDAALQGTASYIINAVRPPAVPAYPAANPCGMGNWAQSVLSDGCNCNNFSGCCR